MRVAPLGACFADDLSTVIDQAARSAEVTHTHPEAIAGAIAVAVATALAWQRRQTTTLPEGAAFLDRVIQSVPASIVRDKLIAAYAIPADTTIWELDEFSACLVAGDATAPHQRPLAPPRIGSRRRLKRNILTLPVFFAWFRRPRLTPPSQGRAGAILTWRASRLLPLAHRTLVLALTGGVRSPLPEPGRQTLSPSRAVWWATQLRSQRQHLLNRRQRAARAATCDMCQLCAQSQPNQVRADELSRAQAAALLVGQLPGLHHQLEGHLLGICCRSALLAISTCHTMISSLRAIATTALGSPIRCSSCAKARFQ